MNLFSPSTLKSLHRGRTQRFLPTHSGRKRWFALYSTNILTPSASPSNPWRVARHRPAEARTAQAP
ncbi:MAG: hypothetical protein ACLSHC_04530 [Bilophila wadsworthia]